MKRIKLYLSMLLLTVIAVGCNDEFDTPPMVVPQANVDPNTTIADFKAKYWQNVNNFIDTVKEDIVIHGRVISSDESGNIYKSLYIQDETGALSISINGNSLYNTYRIGQEIVIPLQNYFVGKYNGQLQLGYPAWYSAGGVWEATFLPLEMWESMVQINGMPNVAMVDTVPCSIADLGTDEASLLKWQGQLVKFEDVKFQDADGEITFSEAGATTNRSIVDANGATLVVRNSNYASFRAQALPMGTGTVVGVLSYYNTSRTSTSGGTWQLYLRSAEDCIGFLTDTKGLMKDPYNIEEAIAAQNQGKKGWVMGYIVGAVAPEVTSVSSNDDIEWGAPTTLANTIVLAMDPECRDFNQCVVVPLPANTQFRTDANLANNENAYKSLIYVKGTLASYMGMAGITENSGSTDEYKMTVVTGGVTELSEGFDSSLPLSWTNVVVTGDKQWYQTSFNGNGYAAMTGFKGTKPPFDAWLITPALDIKNAKSKILNFKTQVNGYGSTTSHFEVYVLNSNDPTMATVKVKLNPKIAVAPSSGYSDWVESGDLDLSQFADGSYFVGFRFEAQSDANYATWCVDDVNFGAGGSSGSATRGDFETFNDGTPTATYGSYASKAGWKAVNASLLQGGAADGNPIFTFIGFKTGSTKDYAMAVNLNGKASSPGVITSPVISGGIGELSFDYGMAYTDSKIEVRVEIKENGQVLKQYTVGEASPIKYQPYHVNLHVNTAGNLEVEFTNTSPTQATSNKDRIAIWNVEWTEPGLELVRKKRH